MMEAVLDSLIAAHGPETFGAFVHLALLIADEIDAERYEWAAFWRDEMRYLSEPR